MEKKRKTVKFSKSPIMSTYLLAFTIGEFDFVEGKTKDGLPIRVFTPLGKSKQGEFGLEVCSKVIPLFEDYFGKKYPLPKLDLIAIPDFAAGAMENWGLITYRETALLFDETKSSAKIKQRVALVVSHECAHMWFGNLVTMEWWDQLWLNEGFATWVEYLAVDVLFPKWDIFEQFVDDEYAAAQRLDGLANSHPIEVSVYIASEIDQIFDGISYSKGCAVIRMLAEYVGLETFKDSLKSYLSKHIYSNATTKDLWDAISEKSNKDIPLLMDCWTKQTGYPVLNVIEKSNENGIIQFKIVQNKFLSNGVDKNDQTLWNIPLGYITSKNPKNPKFINVNKFESIIEVESDIKWIKFNPNQTGFYRVNYEEKYYGMLSKAILNNELNSIDRLGIQNDLSALSEAGYIKTSQALNIFKSYKNETSYVVWSGISTSVSKIYNLIKFEDIENKFSNYACQLFKEQGKKLGWKPKDNETHLDSLLRGLIISDLGKFGDSEIIDEVKKLFVSFVKDNSTIIPDLRTAFYNIAIKNIGKNAYDEILKIYNSTDLNEEQVRIIGSLGCINDKEELLKLLDWGWKNIKKQDLFYLFSGIASNKYGRDLVWDYFKSNIEEFKKSFSSGSFMSYYVKIVTSGFNNDEQENDVKNFFEKNQIGNADRAIKQSLENINSKAKWFKRDKDDIKNFLKDY